MEKSRWQQEFDALPEWAQKMVRALQGSVGYGFSSAEGIEGGQSFNVLFKDSIPSDWSDGYSSALDLAQALTAPWPPPVVPAREKRSVNIVEMMTDGDEDCAFDQPCAFGHRVDGHAVYCHNEAWPHSPGKCRRSTRQPDHRHEDCPGFVANPDADAAKSW